MKTMLLNVVIVMVILVWTINENFYANTNEDSINWVHSYDEGLKKAEEIDKNMFILITAPSWCYYCKLFEDKVLIKKEIQDYLNEHYVPVLVLDQINGKRNPDLSRFVFPGFPTVYVYDKFGDMVKDVSIQDAKKMLSLLKEYAQVPSKEVTKGSKKEKRRTTGDELTPEAKKEIDNFMNEWVRK